MNSPIEGLGQPRFDPFTGKPLKEEQAEPVSGRAFWEEQASGGEHVADTLPPPQVIPAIPPGGVNPYAPTGWAGRNRVESDVELPSGQLVRVRRLEREDLVRLRLMGYMDTFTPILMEDTVSAEERNRRIKEKMGNDTNAIADMFAAIDQVVMFACVRPRVTSDQKLADYGGPQDWENPNFIATAFIEHITMDDRFAVFAASFGRSMEDLKSFRAEADGMVGVAAESGVQQDA